MDFCDYVLDFVDVAADDHELGNVQDRYDAVDLLFLKVDTDEDDIADLNEVVYHEIIDDICFELWPP